MAGGAHRGCDRRGDTCMHEAIEFPVTFAYRGMRLDRFLQHMLPRMSRTKIQDAIASRVTLQSGAVAKAARQLTVGDVILISPRPEPMAPAVPVPILAQGAGWLVVDKPAGISSTPSSRRPGEDVATLLQHAPAHRLDRFTSGCLLLTKDRAAARAIDLAFRHHQIEKQYLAIVHGTPAQDRFCIEVPLGLQLASRVTGKVGIDPAGARACTEVEVLARQGERTLVCARPRTGRRHQIRAQLAHIGHAIVGDLLYGADERDFIRLQRGQDVQTPDGLVAGRHLLHAHRLTFPDPVTREPITVAAPLPADFGEFADGGDHGAWPALPTR